MSTKKFTKRLLSGAIHRSMPLIIPNDTSYDISTNKLNKIHDERRTSLKLVPETLHLLESIQRPLAVLAIGGPCRTGKSYVLSRALGSPDAFALGHTMEAQTFGIWIGTTVMECDEFTVLLMDTEGIDSTNAKARDDASILVMTVLLSSYFIYNSIGVPKKNDLQKMSHFAKLATSIAIKDVSDPETFELKNYFPNFLWLLRDAVLKVPSGQTPTDYLKTVVLKRGKSFDETANDKIGRVILTVFPSIECRTIQPPSADPEVMQNIVAKQDSLEPRFNEQIEDLIKYLFQNVKAKSGFMDGKLVDGPLLAAMASQFLDAVNNPDAIPCITDTWQTAVEIRCKKMLDQMTQEYIEEMNVKIADIGLPMEEDSVSKNDSSKPCTLFSLHRSTLLQKTELLLKKVGHFISGPISSAEGGTSSYNRETLIAELEKRIAVFSEDTILPMDGPNMRKKKVIGGALFEFVQHNNSESRSYCHALFKKLYMKIEEKIEKGDESYTFEELSNDLKMLQEEYHQKAVGPAKWEVYTEKESFIKSQGENYKRLHGFKKKTFDALQKAAEEKARNDQLNNVLDELQIQTKNDAEMNQKKIEAMEKEHKEEMKNLHKEQEEKMKKDHEKYEDFMKAQLSDMAEITQENAKSMKEAYEERFKSMEALYEQNQEALKVMNASVYAMKQAIENMPRKTTCFVAGTMVKLSDGQELPIEKQRQGIKILALGGETTTITYEFVQHTLKEGQKLFGFNDDTPFAALHHPFWTTEGWKCLDPETAKEENPDVDFKLLQVGDIIFRIAQTNPFLYEPVKIHKFTFLSLEEPTKIYGLHLDGPRSYHANGYAVMANYPVLTKKRIREGMKKLSEEEKESLAFALSSAKVELTKVLGSWAEDALSDLGLTTNDMKD